MYKQVLSPSPFVPSWTHQLKYCQIFCLKCQLQELKGVLTRHQKIWKMIRKLSNYCVKRKSLAMIEKTLEHKIDRNVYFWEEKDCRLHFEDWPFCIPPGTIANAYCELWYFCCIQFKAKASFIESLWFSKIQWKKELINLPKSLVFIFN